MPVTLRVPDDLSSRGSQEMALRQLCPSSASRQLADDEYIGTLFIQFDEPMGQITDANTGQPIAGASITLYKVPDWRAQVDPDDLEANTCESLHSRLPDSPWNQPAPTELGVRVDPALQKPALTALTPPPFGGRFFI